MAGTSLSIIERVAREVGATVLPDNAQWEMRLEIDSETSTRVYTVARNKANKTWGCSCPGWKSRRTCKHLNAMVPQLESALKRAAHGITDARKA
jgi:hypothetical protein